MLNLVVQCFYNINSLVGTFTDFIRFKQTKNADCFALLFTITKQYSVPNLQRMKRKPE